MTALHVAAVLLFVLGPAHPVLGERDILVRLFRRDICPGAAFTIRTLRFAWHITTVTWWGMAALLWQAASGALGRGQMLSVPGWTMLLSGMLPLAMTRGRHLSWIVLFAVGGLALWSAAV